MQIQLSDGKSVWEVKCGKQQLAAACKSDAGAAGSSAKGSAAEVYKEVDNVHDLHTWVNTSLARTHSLCFYGHGAKPAKVHSRRWPWVLVAVRRDLGDAKCVAHLGCNAASLHPRLPSDCVAPP